MLSYGCGELVLKLTNRAPRALVAEQIRRTLLNPSRAQDSRPIASGQQFRRSQRLGPSCEVAFCKEYNASTIGCVFATYGHICASSQPKEAPSKTCRLILLLIPAYPYEE